MNRRIVLCLALIVVGAIVFLSYDNAQSASTYVTVKNDTGERILVQLTFSVLVGYTVVSEAEIPPKGEGQLAAEYVWYTLYIKSASGALMVHKSGVYGKSSWVVKREPSTEGTYTYQYSIQPY